MKILTLLTLAWLLVFPTVRAANPIYLELTLNGNEVPGDVTLSSIGGIDTSNMIEVVAFRHELLRAVASTGGVGKRSHKPITFTKRLDKATPLLYQGISQNSPAEAVFRFFRLNSKGETKHFMTFELRNARIIRAQPWVPNILDPQADAFPPMEEISIVYQEITVTDEIANTTVTISVSPEF